MESQDLGQLNFVFGFKGASDANSQINSLAQALDKVYESGTKAAASAFTFSESVNNALVFNKKMVPFENDVFNLRLKQYVAKLKEVRDVKYKALGDGGEKIFTDKYNASVLKFTRNIKEAKKESAGFADIFQDKKSNKMLFASGAEKFWNNFSNMSKAGAAKSFQSFSQGFITPISDFFSGRRGKGQQTQLFNSLSNFSKMLGGAVQNRMLTSFGGIGGISRNFGFANAAGISAAGVASVLGGVAAFAGLAKVLKTSWEESNKFQDSWAKVNTVLEMGKRSSAGLRDSVIKLSADFGVSATDVAEGFYLAVSSGIKDTNDALEVTRVSAMAAAAGFTRTEVAVDGLTTVLNAYNLNASESERVSDMFFTTVLEGKATFEELSRSVGIAIPFFAQAGIKLEDFFSSVATLSQGGLRTNIIMTALRGVIAQVIKPADSALKISKALGIEFTTEAIAAKGLVGWLKELAEKTKMNTDLIAAMFPDVRGLTAVLALYGKQSETNARINKIMAERVGVTAEAFEKQRDTLDKQLELLRSKFNPAMIALGDIFTGPLKNALKNFNNSLASMQERSGLVHKALVDQDIVLNKLIPEYEKLNSKVYKTTEEKEDLRLVIKAISDIIPEAISKWDDLGNALDINVERVLLLASSMGTYNNELKEALVTSNEISLDRVNSEIEKTQQAFTKAAEKQKELLRSSNFKHLTADEKASLSAVAGDDVEKLGKRLSKLYSEQRRTMEALNTLKTESIDKYAKVSVAAALYGDRIAAADYDSKRKQMTAADLLEEFQTKKDSSETERMRVKFNEHMKAIGHAEIQFEKVADIEAMLENKTHAGAESYWRDFVSTYEKEGKKATKEAEDLRQQILQNFVKNIYLGEDSIVTQLSASQTSRLVDILSESYPEIFKKLEQAANTFDKSVAEEAVAELKPFINKVNETGIIPDDRLKKKIKSAASIARQYFEEILGGPIDEAIFKRMWQNYDSTFKNVTNQTQKDFIDGTLKSWEEMKAKLEEDGIVTGLAHPRNLDVTRDQELNNFRSAGLLGKVLLGDKEGLQPYIKSINEQFEKLVATLQRLSPIIGGFVSDLTSSLKNDILNKDAVFNIGSSMKKGLEFAGVNFLFNAGSSIFNNIIKMFGGGKSLLDVVNEQIQTREAVKSLKEELKTKSQASIEEAMRVAKTILSQNVLGDNPNEHYTQQKLSDIGKARLVDEFNRLGISIPAWALEDTVKLLKWLNDFVTNAGNSAADFGKLDVKTFSGIIGNFETLVGILDITDITEKWKLFIDLLKNSTDDSARQLGKLFESISDPTKIDDAASLIRQFIAGGGLGSLEGINGDLISKLQDVFGISIDKLIAIFKSSNLTPEELEKLLESIQGIGKELDKGIQDGLDRTSVSRNVSITEQQGWTIIGIMNSMQAMAERIEASLATLLNILTTNSNNGQPLLNGVGGGGNTINIQQIIINANSEEQGIAAGKGLLRTLRTTEQRLRASGIKISGQISR